MPVFRLNAQKRRYNKPEEMRNKRIAMKENQKHTKTTAERKTKQEKTTKTKASEIKTKVVTTKARHRGDEKGLHLVRAGASGVEAVAIL